MSYLGIEYFLCEVYNIDTVGNYQNIQKTSSIFNISPFQKNVKKKFLTQNCTELYGKEIIMESDSYHFKLMTYYRFIIKNIKKCRDLAFLEQISEMIVTHLKE